MLSTWEAGALGSVPGEGDKGSLIATGFEANSSVWDGEGIGYCVPKHVSKPSLSASWDSAPFSPASLS